MKAAEFSQQSTSKPSKEKDEDEDEDDEPDTADETVTNFCFIE